MKSENPLEKVIEQKVVAFAKTKGVLCYKFVSPSRMSVPDRLFFASPGVVWLIEFKRRGQKPTPAQAVEIEKLRSKGVKVFVVDNVEEGKRVVEEMVDGAVTFD